MSTALTRPWRVSPDSNTSTSAIHLTGTPGYRPQSSKKPLEIIGNLMPPALEVKDLLQTAGVKSKYLHNGDIIEASIGTADKVLDLGVNAIR